jgi:hypothetical protein
MFQNTNSTCRGCNPIPYRNIFKFKKYFPVAKALLWQAKTANRLKNKKFNFLYRNIFKFKKSIFRSLKRCYLIWGKWSFKLPKVGSLPSMAPVRYLKLERFRKSSAISHLLTSASVPFFVGEEWRIARRTSSSAKTGPKAPFWAEDVVRRSDSNTRDQRPKLASTWSSDAKRRCFR